jgi:excinuclease ABC subunit A
MLPARLRGACTHNLKSLDLDFPPGEFVAITGVSGAGKSSLALDTLYAEGQRRYIESFSPYVRQFLERLERPPVQSLDPIPAGVAVDRRAPIKSSRSTVATLADLEPYLSALFTREALPVCPKCGEVAHWLDPAKAAAELSGKGKAMIAYPVVVRGTADYLEVRDRLAKDGFRRLWLHGELKDVDDVRPSDALQGDGTIEVIVDRIDLSKQRSRAAAALEQAWKRAEGQAHVLSPSGERQVVRRGLSCINCGTEFQTPRASLFSYQSPVGACPACHGFGRVIGVDWNKVIPDPNATIAEGAIKPWNGSSAESEREMLDEFCSRKKIPTDVPWSSLSKEQQQAVLEGEGSWRKGKYPGVKAWFTWLESRAYKMHVRVFLSRYRAYDVCTSCEGKRLNAEALTYRVAGHHLAAWHDFEIFQAYQELTRLTAQTAQGELIRKELLARLNYLVQVGLGYLSLSRQARTLSGGEAQRVSLTAALGTNLTGAMFVLDEPTIGLHAQDIPPLVTAIRELARRGNTVLTIEHDETIIEAADRVIELGPEAGSKGGYLLFDGPPEGLAQHPEFPTGKLLAGHANLRKQAPRKPRGWLRIEKASEHNLKGDDVSFPLGVLCVVTGPSGSGKSTLVGDILYRTLLREHGDFSNEPPGNHGGIVGHEAISSVIHVDQSPLGRTSRGNAATYTKAWDRIRARFAAEPEAQEQGLTASHFSFNVAEGRCEACAGEGAETVEMQFLADVTLSCPACKGKRFQEHVLRIKHAGNTVAEMLERTVDEVLDLFPDDKALVRALQPLRALGLGYLPLGQSLNTLSGGEAQRLKIARAFKGEHHGVLYLLDEPSAGLHADDVSYVIDALKSLVHAGASVIVVEHDLEVIETADWVIDLGPGAGHAGGHVVAQGTPSALIGKAIGSTAIALINKEQRLLEKLKRSSKKKASGKSKVITTAALVPLQPDELELSVENAREHNLRNVSCSLPLGKLTVFTGPSGSGKSTLAFDVIFSEGQRRFLETLTPYARQFMPVLPRADVDHVSGVPPSIALEQRTSRAGANSTVATVTEVAHYLRLLFAKVGDVHCPKCDHSVQAISKTELFQQLQIEKGKVSVYAPAVRARKGVYLDLFTQAHRAGIESALCDGVVVSTHRPPKLKKSQEHTIDLIILDQRPIRDLTEQLFELALKFGQGSLRLRRHSKQAVEVEHVWSIHRTCVRCGTGVPELDPRWFSFNTKQGQCDTCEGSGVRSLGDEHGSVEVCAACDGTRLAPIPRAVRLCSWKYHELMLMSVSKTAQAIEKMTFFGEQAIIAQAAVHELKRRLSFLENVGLGYLGLGRAASTLSGGEMQRLRLSAQLGAGLTGALYVLDEPTIGLHPRDTHRLLANLRALVDTGSTVLVVEHDQDTIMEADYLVDLGPSGGRTGGCIVAHGEPQDVLQNPESPTARALSQPFQSPRENRGKSKEFLEVTDVWEHNLKHVKLRVPLARMCVVAGVSGSGKSTLVRKVLLPALRQALKLVTPPPGAFGSLSGSQALKRAVAVDQSPIGRTPRSVPATFLGIWDDIRKLYAKTPDAQMRGFSATRFSFNSAQGGRCSTCAGQGVISHEMAFLPEVITPCSDCNGLRFEPSTLEVTYRGYSIGDVLKMSSEEAAEHFSAHRKICNPLKTLSDLGVGYVQLGQGSHTLSGGEAQRLKLAAELTAGTKHEATLYVLDEPTTGLHLGDVSKLMEVMARLVDRGDTLLVIEHHPWVIAAADHVVELGPEGGDDGGYIVAEGTPAEVAKLSTATGKVLRDLMNPAPSKKGRAKGRAVA